MLFQKALEKKRNNEGGFTLIELLVVMIIIGILAAIAIPVFLGQKTRAHETAAVNDARNAATYAETYAVGNNGTYGAADGSDLDTFIADVNNGFKASPGVTVDFTAGGATGFVVKATFTADLNADTAQYASAATPQLTKIARP